MLRLSPWLAVLLFLEAPLSLGHAAPTALRLAWDASPSAHGYVVASCEVTWHREVPCRMTDEPDGHLAPTVLTYTAQLPTSPEVIKCFTVLAWTGAKRSTPLYWICVPPPMPEYP